jgi:hypothetical protein
MFKNISVIGVLFFLLLGTYFVYSPGLSGGFLLDDQASLGHLKKIDGELSAERLYDYFAASRTGILKRPISVFSFLIDAQTWPAEAYSFKRTNVIIHLINGGLLFYLLYCLFLFKTSQYKKSLFIAFMAAALWLLNPFLVSTTLYIVQRMAMLPATFTLLGLLAYLLVRKRYDAHPTSAKSWALFLIVGSATLLAALSKENGILFAFLVVLFEYMICRNWLGFKPLLGLASRYILKIPMAILVLGILLQIPGAIDGYDIRTFSMGERLLSQFRAVSSYLYYLFLPDYFTAGVFTDGFKASISLIDPITTLFSVILVTGLLSLAWIFRKRWVWFSFAVFFFFISQILESTVFPLELYFEHRSYLSALFLFVPVALFLYFLLSQSKIYIVAIIALLTFWSMFTYLRTSLWGDHVLLMEQSMEKFPESVRARTLNAIRLDKMGLKIATLNVIEEGIPTLNVLELRINSVLLRCDIRQLKDDNINRLISDFKTIPFRKDDINPMASLMHKMILSGCDYEFSNQQISDLLKAFEDNPITNTPVGQSWVDNYWAKFYLFRLKEKDKAFEKYLLTYENNRDIYFLLDAVKDFMAENQVDLAREMLKIAQTEYEDMYRFKIDWEDYENQISQLNKELIKTKP